METIKKNLKRKISLTEGFEPIATDEEYYFALGQLATFIKSNGKKANPDDVVKFTRTKNATELKKKIVTFFKTNYDNVNNSNNKLNNMLAMVADYEPETNKVDDILLVAGILEESILYE